MIKKISVLAVIILLFSFQYSYGQQIQGRYQILQLKENLLVMWDTQTGKAWKSFPCPNLPTVQMSPDMVHHAAFSCWGPMRGGAAEPNFNLFAK